MTKNEKIKKTKIKKNRSKLFKNCKISIYIVLLDVEFKEKDLQKLVKKINECYEKKQNDKLLKEAKRFMDYLSDSALLSKILYVLASICEEYDGFLTSEDVQKVKALSDNPDEKIRLNAMSILGMYYLNHTDLLLEPAEFNYFFNFITNKDPEIRENVLIVLNDLSDDFNNLLLLKYGEFFKAFLQEKESEKNSAMLLKIIFRVLKYIPLSICLKNLIELESEISKEKEQWKLGQYKDLLTQLIPDYGMIEDKALKNPNRSDLVSVIKNRVPILKIYDLEQLSKETESSVEEVEEELKKITPDESVFSNFFTINNKRFYLELELDRFLKKIDGKKVGLLEIYEMYKTYNIKTSIFATIIRNLIDSEKTYGYLSPTAFYHDDYLVNEITKEINKTGKLDLGMFKDIETNYIKDLLFDLNKQGKNKGIFNQSNTMFLSFKGLQKELESKVSKESVIDLSDYKKMLKLEDFLELEEYCIKEKFITEFREGTILLTPVGLLRIMNKIRKESEVFGVIDIPGIQKELNIPKQIIKDVVVGVYNINTKSGLWDNDGDKFYFTQYLKDRIKKVEIIKEEQARKDAVEKLSEELNINVQEISRRMDDRTKNIAEAILKEDIVDIPAFQKQMGMSRTELLDYINRLDKPFLVLDNSLILNETRIEMEKKNIKQDLLRYCQNHNDIKIKTLSSTFKVSEKIIIPMFEELVKEKQISGIWIGKNGFLTEVGIRTRILSKKDFFSLYSIFGEIELNEEETKFVEAIIAELMEKGQLEGKYDIEQKVFESTNFSGSELVESAKSRFFDMINEYCSFFSNVYDYVKAILMETDLRPSDIDNYRAELDRVLKESVIWDRNLKRQLFAGNEVYRKYLRNFPADSRPNVRKFEDLEDVKNKYNNFKAWKTLLDAVDQKAGEIIFLRKKIKMNPKDEEPKIKLHDIYEYLSFND